MLKMDKIVSEIVDVLLSLPEGTELATSDVIKQLYGHKYLTCGDYEIHGKSMVSRTSLRLMQRFTSWRRGMA